MVFLFGITWQSFFILCFVMVFFVAVLCYGFPDLFKAFLILIISASIGFGVGRILAPFLFVGFSAIAIDYFGFILAGGVVLMSRAYLQKKWKYQVRY